METQEEFNRKRKIGLRILWVNLICAALGFLWVPSNLYLYILIGYTILSLVLLANRYRKYCPENQTPEKENYIFGQKLGSNMMKTPQKFILEATMMSLVFITLGSLAGCIYGVFFSELSLFWKIVSGVSGTFGAILMIMVLITTFQSYKALIDVEKIAHLSSEMPDLKSIILSKENQNETERRI